MSMPLIAPIVFPSSVTDSPSNNRPGTTADRLPIPLASLPPVRTGATIYGMAAVDSGGRVADNVVLRTLAWGPGTALDLEIRHGLVVIHATAHGTSAVTPQGFLRLSVSLRRRLDLHAGDRVLLAAYPDHQLLVVHPPIALDDLLAPAHAPLLGGDPA